MTIETGLQSGPRNVDFIFTIAPKTEAFLNSNNIVIEGDRLIYLYNNVKIPLFSIPDISEGFSNVTIKQIGDTRKLNVDYQNNSGPISKIVNIDDYLPKGNEKSQAS